MKKRGVISFILLVIFVSLVSLNFVSAVTNVSECRVLNESDTIYELNQSIDGWNVDCISIEANNVTLDCLGHNITYGGEEGYDTRAIDNVEGYNDTTIKNCIISQTGSVSNQPAIVFEASENAIIFNNTIITLGGSSSSSWDNSSSGIWLGEYSINANISSNTINTSGDYGLGIFLGDSDNSTIEDNNIITSGYYSDGLHFDGSSKNNVTNNTITTSGEDSDGIYNDGNCSFSLIYDNIITTSGEDSDGIYLNEDSSNMSIPSNNITTSATDAVGIYLESDSNLIYSNVISTTGFEGDGIYINYAFNNNLTNNILNTTNGYAIFVHEATGTHIHDANHTIENNTEQGNMIYYLFNNDTVTIQDETVGQIIVANSNNITLNNLNLSEDGIIFLYTDNSTISNSSINIPELGIVGGLFFCYSHYNNIINNTITTSRTGVDGICIQSANHSTFTQNKIHAVGNNSFVIYSYSSGNNTFYNNYFNASTINSLSGSGFGYSGDTPPSDFNWNTTKALGTNILDRGYIGGNFWTNNEGTGYSDDCIDSDGDYICDNSYSTATNNIDYFPLADHTNGVFACGTLNVVNKLYYLNQSLNVTENCFNIAENNITFDFAGHNISGNGSGYGIKITNYNNVTINNGSVCNFSNGIYISSGSEKVFNDININDSQQDAIFLTGATSDNNNFTNIVVTNTSSSYYDIKFDTAGIDGTWITNINFANYSFTGAGGKVNFREPSFGEIKFLEAINGSGSNLAGDVDIENNSIFVNSSGNAGLNRSANITLYSITYTDPIPQYKLNSTSSWINCTTTSDPACTNVSFSGNTFVFNTSHFTYFQSAEGYDILAEDDDGDGSSSGGGASSFWTQTYYPNDEEFEEGYTKELEAKHRIRIIVNDEYHYVGVVELTDTLATINISSDPVQIELGVDGEAKVDMLNDSYYDLYVKVLGIEDDKANITIQKIHEEVLEGDSGVLIVGEEEETLEEDVPEEDVLEEKNLIWLLVLFIVVFIFVVLGVVYKLKKGKKKLIFIK